MHATLAELEAYTFEPAPPDGQRLLQRATEMIDTYVFGMYEIDSVTNLPIATKVREALRDATCAQVEFWLQTGDEADVLSGHSMVSIPGAMTTSGARTRLAPRAKNALSRANLLQAVIA